MIQNVVQITQHRRQRRPDIMRQIQHQLILAALGKIPPLHSFLQLLARPVDVFSDNLKLIVRGDLHPGAKLTVGEIMNTRGNCVKIGGVALGQQEKKEDRQRHEQN
ncbi:hypothetical protein D3C73_858940 [compost metagenome]